MGQLTRLTRSSRSEHAVARAPIVTWFQEVLGISENSDDPEDPEKQDDQEDPDDWVWMVQVSENNFTVSNQTTHESTLDASNEPPPVTPI